MDKKLKDYLHLYLGCKAEISNDKAFIIDIITPSSLTMCYSNMAIIKPILRPLSDMTEEECNIDDDLHFNEDLYSGGRWVSFCHQGTRTLWLLK